MTLTAVINPVVPLNLPFPLQRVICPQSRQSAKYRIVTHNFTNDDLTIGKSPSYQSLVNIPPAPLRSPLRPATEETPVPATGTLSYVTVFPAKPAPFLLLHKKPRSPSVENFHILDPDQNSASVPEPSHFSHPSTDHSEGARNGKVLGRTPTFDRDRGSGKFSRWECTVFSGEIETWKVRREGRARRRESGLREPGSRL